MGWRRSFFAGRAGELDEEIRSHLEMAVRDRVARGESPEAARAAVMLEFGNVALVKDVAREMRGWGWLDRLLQDLRFALRQLRKSPGFTITALLTIALAVGANTAIFSLGYALLLRSLPIDHPERLVQLELRTTEPEPMPYLSTAMYQAVKERQRVFSGMCAWESGWFSGEQNGDGRDIFSARLSGDCAATLGLRPALGRLLTEADDKAGGQQTAVISYAWWESRFHRDPAVIGKTLVLLNPFGTPAPVSIVGVLPASFQSLLVGDAPMLLQPMGEDRNNSNQSALIFARLGDGVTMRQAEEQIAPGFHAWDVALPPNQRPESLDVKGNPHLEVTAARAGYSGVGHEYKKPLLLLQILVGLLLLASCAYLGTLFSARSVARRREIALRAALGASRGRLVRQLFSESLLLAFVGGAAGVLLAWVASRFLMTFVDAETATIAVGPGRDVLLFTLGITALSVVMWGLIPALRASRVDVVTDMRSGAGGLSGAQRRVGRWLVPVQIALSLIVVVVAGLLSTTLVRLLSQNNGYRMGGMVFASTDFPFAFGKEAQAKIAAELALQQSVLERLNHAPGVEAASIGMIHVLNGASYLDFFSVTPSFDASIYKTPTVKNHIGARYFEILGTRVLEGREFSDADTASSQPVCVLTRAAARHFFPNASALGRILYEPEEKDEVRAIRVIGVVEDMRYLDLRKDAPPIVYLDFAQVGEARNLEFVMKTEDPAGAVNSLREILRAMAPGVHVSRSITMEEQVDRSLARERLLVTLSNFFAGLGLLLGAISVYGMLNYSVNCRTAEIGLRMALGATRGNVVRMIVGEATRLVVPGLVVGAVACAATTRLLRSLLYETKTLDPLTSVVSVAAIVCVAMVASWLPARRASRVDPMEALRAE